MLKIYMHAIAHYAFYVAAAIALIALLLTAAMGVFASTLVAPPADCSEEDRWAVNWGFLLVMAAAALIWVLIAVGLHADFVCWFAV